MQPDIKREQRNGWLVLAAAGIIALGGVGWYWDDSDLANRLESAKSQYSKMHGPEPMQVHIKRQKLANANLEQTIEELKAATGFPDATFFTITEADHSSRNPASSIFIDKFYSVQDECDKQARNFGLKKWPAHRDLGFPEKGTMPSDAEVPYLMTMLQLTRRAARICFSTPPLSKGTEPIKDIQFLHEPKQEKPTGPDGRPPLLTEYPLTIRFTASLTETMWILWRFSVGKVDESSQPANAEDRIEDKEDPGEYPFILQSFTIQSPVTEELDKDASVNYFLTVTMKIAGVKFVTQQTRQGMAPTPGVVRPAGPSAASGSGSASAGAASTPATSHITARP